MYGLYRCSLYLNQMASLLSLQAKLDSNVLHLNGDQKGRKKEEKNAFYVVAYAVLLLQISCKLFLLVL